MSLWRNCCQSREWKGPVLDADLSCWLPAENEQLETGLFSSSAEGTRHYCHCEEMAEGQLLPREAGAPQGTVRGALRADRGLLPEPRACEWVSLPKAPPKPLGLCYLARPERAAQLQEGPDGWLGMAPAGLQSPWWPRCAGAVAEGWLSCRLQKLTEQRHERCKLGPAVDHVRAAPRCAHRPLTAGLWCGAAGLCLAGAGARRRLASLETPGRARHGPCPQGEHQHGQLCSLRTTNRVRTRVWREPVPRKSDTTSGSLRLLCLTVAAGLSPSCSFMCVNCNH